MATVANTRIKHNGEVYLPGEELPQGDFDKKEVTQLLEAGAIVSKEQWDKEHPEGEDDTDRPTTTPSNMWEIEGTALAADPEKGGVGDSEKYNAEQKKGKGEDDETDEALRDSANPNPKQQTRQQKANPNDPANQ